MNAGDETTAVRWREAGALFHELVELDESSRSERLSRVGDSDPDLRAAVEALLAGDAIADQALPCPGFGLAAVRGGDTLGLEGETIGRFLVRERIAWGGMGVVYRAGDLQLHRTVALKFPLVDSGLTEPALAHTLREARSAGALDHPNLCPIYEVGESAAGPFMVMPLYRGVTLKERIATAAPLAVGEALAIVEQLAAGLSCAHDAGIVHCDIKPGNVMLLPDGTVKLLDFGLARASAAGSSLPGGAVGTVHYMAPEQIRDEPIDARVDLWAVGVILHEMLIGARPFTGADTPAVVRAILTSVPPPLEVNDPARPAVEALVSALLAKDRSNRMQTAAELTRAVAAAKAHLPSGSARVGVRRPVVAAGLLLGVGVLAGALWLRPPPTLIASGRLSARDTLILADVEVAGLDSTLSPVLTTLLRRDFADSRTVTLMPAGGVNAALARMRLRPGSRVTAEVAREVGRREGAGAVVSGRVSPLASGYVVTLRLTESESGNELASVTTTAAVAERDLLPALARAGQALRARIGTALRDTRAVPAPARKLTTTSLEASRLVWFEPNSRTVEQRVVAERAALRLDSTFAYIWMAVGNQLSWMGFRSAVQDSAFSMAYRFRDNLTLMERAQVSFLYWYHVQLDRRRALAELESAVAVDTTLFAAVPLNILESLVDTRQFARAEAFAKRIEHWPGLRSPVTSALARSEIAQGKYAAADSMLAQRRALRGPGDATILGIERSAAVHTLRFDRAARLFAQAARKPGSAAQPYEISFLRLQGRLAEARWSAEREDSVAAAVAAAAEARFDPTAGCTITLANEALWLRDDRVAALAHLDGHWRAVPAPHDIQDRIDGIRAAALYAAAGRPAKAAALLSSFVADADTLAKRAIYQHRLMALAEIALAERRFADAMRLFRASDSAADGLPASPCAVCVLPHLARVAERAGWSDSARVFWDQYVHRPAIERVTTDQWFLVTAYDRLAASAAALGDTASAAGYRKTIVALRASADPSLRLPRAAPDHVRP